jgi:hypothetical protein
MNISFSRFDQSVTDIGSSIGEALGFAAKLLVLRRSFWFCGEANQGTITILDSLLQVNIIQDLEQL